MCSRSESGIHMVELYPKISQSIWYMLEITLGVNGSTKVNTIVHESKYHANARILCLQKIDRI